MVHALDQMADHARAVRRDDEALHTEHALHVHAPVASDGVHRLDQSRAVPDVEAEWRTSAGADELAGKTLIEHRVAQLAETPVHLCRYD